MKRPYLHLIKHVFAVEVEVAGTLPEGGRGHMGRVDELVAGLHVLLLPMRLDEMPHHCALGMPEHKPGSRTLVQAEEVQFLSYPSVIPGMRNDGHHNRLYS